MTKFLMGIKLISLTTFLIINVLFAEPSLTYLFPKPNSEYLPIQTDIVFSFDKRMHSKINTDEIKIRVVGSKSGKISGHIIKSTDGRRFIFKKDTQFKLSEKVSVDLSVNNIHKEFSFTTSNHQEFDHDLFEKISDAKSSFEQDKSLSNTQQVRQINGVSVPSDFPAVDIRVLKETAPGKIFLNNWNGRPYIMILENDGTPYFYQRVENRARDFKLQPTGTLTRRYIGNLNCFVELDSNYQIIDTLSAAQSYGTDEHGIQLMPNGNYLVMGLDYQTVDMSKIVDGGDPNATVVGNSVQELDRDGNLLFNWRSWDHYKIEDAVHENLTGGFIDYVHMNAIAVDYDGNIVVSSRHLSEITKINRETGEIIWRFGGLHSDFNLTNDQYGISYQHDIRPVPNHPNRYTVMDNGNFHSPNFSRAFEFEVDAVNMTAERVWQYRHTPDRFTWWMGNVQRLPNGNTLINYADASLPKAVEVTPAGEVVYEMDFVAPINCYRTFRFDWESIVDKPYLIAESFPDKVSLIFNKFGDSSVVKYNVYGGQHPNPTTFVTSVENTMLDLTELTNNTRYYFRVTAVDSTGNESEYSNEASVDVKFSEAGNNLVYNGDFSQGSDYWFFATYGNGQASGEVADEEYHIQITDPGSESWHVQFTQSNISLIQGKRYSFQFDAYSTSTRTLDGKVEKNGDPYYNYGKINPVVINPAKKTYKFEFEMEDPTDYNVRVVFNCGLYSSDVFIDNVNLTEVVIDDLEEELEELPLKNGLIGNFPNPFNPATKIKYQIARPEKVSLKVFDILGREIKTIINKIKQPGTHQVEFNAGNLPSGVYICILKAGNFIETKKMMLIK